MSSGPQKRARNRAASVKLPPSKAASWLPYLRQGPVLGRLALVATAALLLLVVTTAWHQPFSFRRGDVPPRDVVARVPFEVPDPLGTQQARKQAREQTPYVYRQDAQPLVQLRGQLLNTLVQLNSAVTLQDLDMTIWREFQPPTPEGAMPPTREEEEEQFEEFRSHFSSEDWQTKFEAALAQVMQELEQRGLLEKLQHSQGNLTEIRIFRMDQPEKLIGPVPVADVLLAVQAAGDSPLDRQLKENPVTQPVADRLFSWLRHRLVPTLSVDPERTAAEGAKAADAVEQRYTQYEKGQVLVQAGAPLGLDQINLLEAEHLATIAQTTLAQRATRTLAMLIVIGGLLVLCGSYVVFRQPAVGSDLRNLLAVLLIVVAAVGLGCGLSPYAWRAETLPLLLFGMVLAIAFGRQLALLLTVSMVSLTVLATGHDVPEFLLLTGIVVTAVLQLTSIRSRMRLINISIISAAVGWLLWIGLGVLDGRELNWNLAIEATWVGGWTIAAGFLITGLLPLIENHFRVLTDLSLLELSDVSHPLLQELVRRAPGTYNHSINVGAIAEAAADSIGARGLLVRVGAYFHDIGKMLKPGYFVENQGDSNRHESLVPAMSTLIIVAHVKDGADLARSHHLPGQIIDFIQQHHGTTLVEFFYDRASKLSQEDPNGGTVSESAFRYPGPKPQTREAAVLMLADASESASRALVDPTPARLENLVNDLAMKRLKDGQFDECGIDLTEIYKVRDSLAKSLIAMYHGRVKYPDQQTA